MSEQLDQPRTSELWFDGPNYTVDAIVIDPIAPRKFFLSSAKTLANGHCQVGLSMQTTNRCTQLHFANYAKKPVC
jgi:hypothetical protein